jgi:hypothetical protein
VRRILIAIGLLGLVAGTAGLSGVPAAIAEGGASVLAEGHSGRTEWRVVTTDSGEPPSRCFALEQRVGGEVGSWHFGSSQCSLPWARLETIGPEASASTLVLLAAATPGYARVQIKSEATSGTRRISLSQVSAEESAAEPIYFGKMMLSPRICVKSITLFGGPQPVIVRNPPDGDPQHCSKSAAGSQ